MRINIHDAFKSWRDFVDVAKRLYRTFNSVNSEITSMCVYVTLANKDTGEFTTLNIRDNKSGLEYEAGIDIGYYEWEDNDYDGMFMKYTYEKELLSQREYKAQRECANRQRSEEALLQDFENNYLPVTKTTLRGRSKSVFKSVADLERRGYDYKKVKKAIDENKLCYNYIWLKQKLF